MAISKIPHRLSICTRDICNILGMKPKTARKLLHRIRESLGKSRHQCVTVREFCRYLAIEEGYVAEYIKA